MIEELKSIQIDKKSIRDFGLLIGCILLVIAGYLFYKGRGVNLLIISSGFLFISSGFILPFILKPVYLLWMYFAVILGWFMTRLILGLVFYFIVSIIGVIARLFGKEFLELKNSSKDNSYWDYKDKEKSDPLEFERQF